jgi:uncharacterized RDD family membrane protein YckC
MKIIKWRNAKKRKISTKIDISQNIVYGTFGGRFFATIMDMFLIIMPINILIGFIYGYETMKNPSLNPTAGIIQMVLTLAVTIMFWKISGQTPGKKALNLYVVDKNSLENISIFRAIIRYLSYFISMISIIGFFLPLFRNKRESLHDLISGTLVIYKKVN